MGLNTETTEEKPSTLNKDLEDKVLEYAALATKIVEKSFPQYHSKPELIVEVIKIIQLEEQWNVN